MVRSVGADTYTAGSYISYVYEPDPLVEAAAAVPYVGFRLTTLNLLERLYHILAWRVNVQCGMQLSYRL
jgi:hypothetical protein